MQGYAREPAILCSARSRSVGFSLRGRKRAHCVLGDRREHRPRPASGTDTKSVPSCETPTLNSRPRRSVLGKTFRMVHCTDERAWAGHRAVNRYIHHSADRSLADHCTDAVLAYTGLATPVRPLCAYARTHNPRRLRLCGAVSVADSWRRRDPEACTADRTMSRTCRTCSAVSTNYLSDAHVLYAASRRIADRVRTRENPTYEAKHSRLQWYVIRADAQDNLLTFSLASRRSIGPLEG